MHHISPKGVRPCTAKKQPCKYGKKFATEAAANRELQRQERASKEAFHMSLSPATKEVVSALQSIGARPIIVGGSVRDQFLGYESKDIDIELFSDRKLSIEEVGKELKKNRSMRVSEAGVSFSVLKVNLDNEEFDISLPRTEVSTGEGHRDYELTSDSRISFEEAASRRDFTINAMGYDPTTGAILDPHGGRADLKAKILRHVGPAFADDPLRALRAVNFASRFGFKIHPDTQELCRQLAPAAKHLSHERIEEEFNKVFSKGKHGGLALTTLHEIGWSEQLPGFRKYSRAELETFGKQLNSIKSPRMRKTLLVHQLRQREEGMQPVLESKGQERAHQNAFTALVEASRTGDQGDLIAARRVYLKNNKIDGDVLTALKFAGTDSQRVKNLPAPQEPSVTGKLLLERGFNSGPEMGRVIKTAQRIQDHEGITDPDELIRKSLSS